MAMTDNMLKLRKAFLEDVVAHEMTILKDDGVYRHIRLSRPEVFHQRFDVITWPGYLCYTGDMGTYTFERLEDMFVFFRGDINNIEIQENYWSEKLLSPDGDASKLCKIYTHGAFEEYVKECWQYYFNIDDDGNVDGCVTQVAFDYTDEEADAEVERVKKESAETWEDMKKRLFTCDQNYKDSYRAMSHYEHNGFEFQELDEYDPFWFTRRFIWCLHALVFAIGKYNEKKGGKDEF